jgi:hypothetical protein
MKKLYQGFRKGWKKNPSLFVARCTNIETYFKRTLCEFPPLARIYKSVVDTMKRQGWFAEELFHYLGTTHYCFTLIISKTNSPGKYILCALLSVVYYSFR